MKHNIGETIDDIPTVPINYHIMPLTKYLQIISTSFETRLSRLMQSASTINLGKNGYFVCEMSAN